MDSPVVVDDSDPAVQYVGTWFEAGVPEEFNSTTHSSPDDGAQAILKFTGSSISVYGTLRAPDTPGKATYSIDGKPGTTITGRTSSINLYRQLLYQSPQLENADHTLTITSTNQGRGYWLDYFSITPNRVTSEQPTSAYSSPLGVEASSIISGSSTDTTSPTRAPPPMSSAKPVRWTGIIVGSVLGGILFLLIIAIWRGSQRRNKLNSRHILTSRTLVDPPMDTSRAGMRSLDASLFNREALSFHKSPVINPAQHSDPLSNQEIRDASVTGEELHFIPSSDAPPTYVERVS